MLRRSRSWRSGPRACRSGRSRSLLGAVGVGLGTLLPVTTVAIQNAVGRTRWAPRPARMNFFRSLGGAIVVAAFGAIVLGGGAASTAAPSRTWAPSPRSRRLDLAGVFRWVFAAAVLGLIAGLGFLLAMEERPLRSGSPRAPAAAAAAE